MRNYSRYGMILGILFILLSIIYYLFISSIWEFYSITLLVVGFILLIVYFLANIRRATEVIVRRDTKFGSNAFASIIIVLGIIVLVNFVFNKRDYRIDLTEGKQFSISPQTVKVVQGLNKEIKITAFFEGGIDTDMEDLFEQYLSLSDKLKFETVDPVKKPDIAKKYEVTQYGTIIIECGDRTEKINSTLEQDLTNTIVKASREKKKVLYFSEGHGEKDIDNSEKEGYSVAKEALEGVNYEVKKIFIAREGKIPDDCSALMIIGPTKELLPNELEMIDSCTNNGGKVFFLLDPEPSPGMNGYFKKWGVDVRNDVVIDLSGIGRLFGAGPGMPLVTDYGPHPITNDFKNVATFFAMTRSIAKMTTLPEDIDVVELAKTTPKSYGEAKLGKGDKPEFNEKEDIAGPLSIGVAVTKKISKQITDETIAEGAEAKEKAGKLVVFGDSDFACNTFVKMQGNLDLFLNVINWLAEEEDLISIRPKNPADRRVDLTAKQGHIFFYLSVFVLPLIFVISGITVYIKRKKL